MEAQLNCYKLVSAVNIWGKEEEKGEAIVLSCMAEGATAAFTAHGNVRMRSSLWRHGREEDEGKGRVTLMVTHCAADR